MNDSQDLLELNNPKIMEMIYKNGTKLKKWIRLRQTGEETTITIKKIINNSKEYQMDNVQEVEIPVPNIEIGKELLENLGYYPTNHQRKMRIAYDYRNTEVVIDKWPKIEPYVEIEGKSKKEICSVIKDLGFKAEDMKVMNTETVYELSGINLYDFEDLDFDEKEEKYVAELMKEYKDEKKHSVIAISGMPAAGKTTLSQELISRMTNLIYFDFGAFFRPIALHLTRDKKMSLEKLERIVSESQVKEMMEELKLGYRKNNKQCEISINGHFFEEKELYNPEMNKLTVDVGACFGDTLNIYIKDIIDKIRQENPVLLNARRPFAVYNDISEHFFCKADFNKRAERKAILEKTSLEEAINRLKARDEKEQKAEFWNTYPFTKVIDTTEIDITTALNIVQEHISGKANQINEVQKEKDEYCR